MQPFLSDNNSMFPVGMMESGALDFITDRDFLCQEIMNWESSKKRKMQLAGKNYYRGRQDILKKERMAIGRFGHRQPVKNLPNTKIIDNQYAKMVNQKVNYLLGKPFTIMTENNTYSALLKTVLGASFQSQLRQIGADALNGGTAWLMPYYDQLGNFRLRRFEPHTILPFWADEEHTILDAAVHMYGIMTYTSKRISEVIKHVEAYTNTGIYYFTYQHGILIPEKPAYRPYAIDENGNALIWNKVPLIAWKYNSDEIPLIRKVKSLQDGINYMESAFADRMLEDPRNSIMVLVNYAGQDLGEFRENLATYGAVSVVNEKEEPGGDLKSISVEVNAENYTAILKIFKMALIENAGGYDAKDDRLANNPNEMNIQSMYSDIDLDANAMETEFQAALEELRWYIDAHFANTGQGDFSNVPVTFTFNRSMMANNGDLITQCKDSMGIVSDRTILAHHPFVDNVDKELAELKQQKQEDMQMYGDGTFSQHDNNGQEEMQK